MVHEPKYPYGLVIWDFELFRVAQGKSCGEDRENLGQGAYAQIRGRVVYPFAVSVLMEIQLLEVRAPLYHFQQFWGIFLQDGLVVKTDEREILEMAVGPRGTPWDK